MSSSSVVVLRSNGTAVPPISNPAARPEREGAAHLHGLRLTIRHQAIMVVHCALLFALLRSYVDQGGGWAYFNATIAALLISPWLLAVLVLLFDRPGPLKFWLAPLSLSLFGPMLAVSYDLNAAAGWMVDGTPPRVLSTLFVNVFFVGWFISYLRQAGPARCPSCDRRAFVPLYSLSGSSPRTSKTRWCAACGVKLWRHARHDPWKPERRRC